MSKILLGNQRNAIIGRGDATVKELTGATGD